MIYRLQFRLFGTICVFAISFLSLCCFHPSNTDALSTTTTSRRRTLQQQLQPHPTTIPPFPAFSSAVSMDNADDDDDSDANILCELQTLLKLTGQISTGGSAKVLIQSGKCQLNGVVETRRAKKLFAGDVVTFGGVEYSVDVLVSETNYVYKPKIKKVKPDAKIDEFGNKEFGGRFRSEEWRAERKEKKKAKKYKDGEWKPREERAGSA